MKCDVCGMQYAGSHNCSGGARPFIPEEMVPPPEGICPGYYLRMAFDVARLTGVAIRRTSRDPDALFYGAIFSTIAASIIFLVTALPKMLTREGATAGTILWGLVLGLLFVCIYSGAVALIQVGVAHFIARCFLGSEGTFFAVLRPALLGWFVNCLTLIPVVGPPLAAIAWTAVLMMVLEEVDHIARLPAFLIAAGINGIFLALLYLVAR
ncbi:MAG TPA: hypothetical protein VGI46_13485 [Candidatus Acidoferrum sp.]